MDRLQAIKARLEAITPGEWHLYDDCIGVDHGSDNEMSVIVDFVHPTKRSRVNAAFIAAAPEDMRYLLGEVERLRTELDKAHVIREEYDKVATVHRELRETIEEYDNLPSVLKIAKRKFRRLVSPT